MCFLSVSNETSGRKTLQPGESPFHQLLIISVPFRKLPSRSRRVSSQWGESLSVLVLFVQSLITMGRVSFTSFELFLWQRLSPVSNYFCGSVSLVKTFHLIWLAGFLERTSTAAVVFESTNQKRE
jgi:hypothetical protein